jgi:hypothetical protein
VLTCPPVAGDVCDVDLHISAAESVEGGGVAEMESLDFAVS